MKCPKCSSNKGETGKVWSATKGWIRCDRCNGTGHIPRPKGFTLLELLVVIVVIIVLLVIMTVGLFRARMVARNTVCKSNIRQIGVSIDAYKGEHRTYPPAQGFIYSRETDPVSLATFLYWMPDVATPQGVWFCQNVKTRFGTASDYDYIPGMQNGPWGTTKSWTNNIESDPVDRPIFAHTGANAVNRDPIHWMYTQKGDTKKLP